MVTKTIVGNFSRTNDEVLGTTNPNYSQGRLVSGSSVPDVIVADTNPATTVLTDQQQITVELDHGSNTTINPTFQLGTTASKVIVKNAGDTLDYSDTGGSGYSIILKYSSALDKWVLLNPVAKPATYDNLAEALDGSDGVGSFVETSGRLTLTGVGGGLYKVVSIDPLLPTINPIKTDGSGNFLELQFENEISISQTSAVGDGVANDFQPVQDAFNSGASIVNGETGKTYLSNIEWLIPTKTTFEANFCTIKSTVTGFQRGLASSLATLIRNKNATILDGSVFDEDVSIKNLNVIVGSDILMVGIQIGSTKNALIQNCNVSTNNSATDTAHNIDFHHSNINGLIDKCTLIQELSVTNRGFCVAFRNSNSLVSSEGNIIQNTFMFSDSTTNTDELMFINGGTGQTNDSKVINNRFETGATDITASVLTVYPFETGGANSQVNGALIEGNSFITKNSTTAVGQCILLGIAEDTTRSAKEVIIDGNLFDMGEHTAVRTINLQDNAQVSNNVVKSSGNGSCTIMDASFRTDTVSSINNRLSGSFLTAFAGGRVIGNHCETAEIFANGCTIVNDNIILNCTHKFAEDFEDLEAISIKRNEITMNNATLPDAFPYVWHLNNADCRYSIMDNTVSYKGNGFKVMRSSTSGAGNIFFDRNRLYKDGAIDAPDFQLFATNYGSSDGLEIFDLNLDAILIGQAYGLAGFLHALGHFTRYTDAVVGVGNPMGKMMTSTGEHDIDVTLS